MNTSLVEKRFPSNQSLQLVQGDITIEEVDAIVNAANERLQHGGGVAWAISKKGGPAIQKESDQWIREHGHVNHAHPAWTSGGHLPVAVGLPADGIAEGIASFTRVAFGNRDAMSQAQIQEKGVSYAADLVAGQKTGFFLDQRDNRLRLGAWVQDMGGGRVLYLFCCSGGWGLRALHAGAQLVTFVDQSRDALQLVQSGLHANRVPAEKVVLQVEDVFEFLGR